MFWGQGGVWVADSAVGLGDRGSRLLRAVPQKLTIKPGDCPHQPRVRDGVECAPFTLSRKVVACPRLPRLPRLPDFPDFPDFRPRLPCPRLPPDFLRLPSLQESLLFAGCGCIILPG